ncbi:MAG: hypothetical protein KAQ89_01445 [Planctomycetes bacterium]|nr:hypothetical protein [Planctomycetota bacterium]
MNKPKSIKTCETFFVWPDYKTAFDKLGLNSLEAVFSFSAGTSLTKKNLAKHRSRIQFEIDSPQTTLFLKRYDKTPILIQLKNWLNCGWRKSMSKLDFEPAEKLTKLGINTPQTIAYGELWKTVFEKRSFVITKKIPNAESLETKLPNCFYQSPTPENIKLRRNFIAELAGFIKKFHKTGFRHRDLYLCHIFYDSGKNFHLIDLARAFKPAVLAERFRIKDITQLYYSAPGKYFSRTDRLRFYRNYASCNKLTQNDKKNIRKVLKKAEQMARHDIKHARSVPFAN